MTKVFIGGSRDISKLSQDIKDKLDNIIKENAAVIVGDANGVDKAVQNYLYENKYSNVTVYCTGNTCRNNIGNWTIKQTAPKSSKKDFNFYTAKDIEMADGADYGFMIWDAESKGTMNNILNLIKNNKKTLLYFMPEHKFYNINSANDLQIILSKCNEKDLNTFKKKLKLTHKLIKFSSLQQKLFPMDFNPTSPHLPRHSL